MATVCTPLDFSRADVLWSDASIDFSMTETCVTTADTGGGSNWQVAPRKKRLSQEELLELIRQQRIELGILPPDPLAPQPLPEAETVAVEVAEAINNRVQMGEQEINYAEIYRLAFYEAEVAIAEYRKEKDARKRKVRRIVRALMLN